MKRVTSTSFVIATAFACVLLGSIDARAAGVDPAEATPAQREQAQQRFTRGRDLFAKRDFAAALDEFSASHEIVASPNARLFVARCQRELGKLVAAYAELGRVVLEAREYEHEDPRYAKTAESANAERDELASQLGFALVTIDHATSETKLMIAGDSIARAGWSEPVPVSPGSAEIVVETPGHMTVRTNVSFEPAERKPITLDATSADPPPPPVVVTTPAPEETQDDAPDMTTRKYAYVAGGIGVAGLFTFMIAGIAANGTYSDLQAQCHGLCDASKSSEISKGKTEQTVANIGLAVGAVGAGLGIALFAISRPKSHDPPSTNAGTVALTAGPSFIGMRGAF